MPGPKEETTNKLRKEVGRAFEQSRKNAQSRRNGAC